MIKESQYCTDMMKKKINKTLVITKEDHEDSLLNFIKCWICDKVYADDDVEVTDHCHITAK